MNAPVTYLTDFVPDADAAFASLMADLDWVRIADRPRAEYYANDWPEPYTYGSGRGRTTYQVQAWHPVMLAIRYRLEARLETVLDVCFANRYDGARDHLGWHADDSPEMDPARPIVTVSLGAVRVLRVRPNHLMGSDQMARDLGVGSDYVEDHALAHGSALVMAPGMQQAWQHSIRKADRVVGPRVSLTYRGYRRT